MRRIVSAPSSRIRLGTLAATVVVAVAVLGAGAVPVVAAPTTTTVASGSVADLEARLRAAQATATEVVGRFQAATARSEELADDIDAVQARIEEGRARAEELRTLVRSRALTAYKERGTTADQASAIFSGGDVLDGLRRTALLQSANARDDAALGQLKVLDQDLAAQQADLRAKRTEADRVVAQIQTERATVEAAVADAQRAFDELVDRLAREAASRAAAEAAARAAARAALPPAPVASGPPVGGFLCPVHGSFTNDFGDPRSGGRSHMGNDIFAAVGTPLVAVKAGSVWYQSGGAGGNMAYVNAADGNTYFYAHLSSFAGGARTVAQGEVIGYVGMTGDSTAPHLHFEIRTPGGTVNPYATLSAAC